MSLSRQLSLTSGNSLSLATAAVATSMTEIPVATETKVDPAGERNDENSGAVVDLRWVRAAKGVDARISMWACFYRVVIGIHHADMVKSDFRSKRDFAQWARLANLAFYLPRGYGVGRRGNNTQSPFGRKSPRKYFVALTQFWHWYPGPVCLVLGRRRRNVRFRTRCAPRGQGRAWWTQFPARARPVRRAV